MRWNRHRLSVIQQVLCVSVLFGVVCPLSLVISYTSEDKHRVRADSISGYVFFSACPTLRVGTWDTHSLSIVCLRAVMTAPSGEERCAPHHTVPVSPQCLQEIGLPTLTLMVLQGAVVSSKHFSQSLPPGNIAELRGSPPLRESLEQLDRTSPAGPLLQGTELAALSTSEASLERLVPLVGHLAVWDPLPSMSHWVLSGVHRITRCPSLV